VSRARDDTFAALGLAARPDLTDDDVRAAWRRIAAATHPDRADGGDPARFAAAAAAYTVLRTRYGRGEALADLADLAGRPGRAGRAQPGRPPATPTPPEPTPRPGPTQPARPPATPAPPKHAARPERGQPGGPPATPAPPESAAAGRSGVTRSGAGLLSRIRRGRVGRLALRVLIAAAISGGAVAVAGAQPATPALVVGAVTWLLITARNDLAPPR
jgi:curved DNA-binding protein CbpA